MKTLELPDAAPALAEELPEDRIETLLSGTSFTSRPPTPGAVTLGILTGWDEAGHPLVAFAGNRLDRALPALATVPLKLEDMGREVALMFVSGDLLRPLIVGLLQPPLAAAPVEAAAGVEARVDGERIEFKAEQEIVLRCGKSSITLTRAGKILIEGAYLLSRSTGVNRIKGGSIQLN